jgi:hypothetical protein
MDTLQNLIVPTHVCSQCKLELPLTNFGRDKQTKTGRLHKCRSCRSDDYYGDHEKNLGYRRERRKHWNLRDTRTPEQKRVHATFQNAVRVGKLVRPETCQKCGAGCVPDGHHKDYARPLDVLWLCRACHKAEHVLDSLTGGTYPHNAAATREG